MTRAPTFISHRDAVAYASSQGMRNYRVLRLEASNYRIMPLIEAREPAPRRVWQLSVRGGRLHWA